MCLFFMLNKKIFVLYHAMFDSHYEISPIPLNCIKFQFQIVSRICCVYASIRYALRLATERLPETTGNNTCVVLQPELACCRAFLNPLF